MKRTTLLGTALALTSVGVLVTACTPGPSAPAATRDDGTLVIGETADTTEVDPQISYNDVSWRIQDMVYDSLVTTDENSQILPSIAASWTVDGATYTFDLQPGVTFANGRALTADDVVGSLQRLIDPALGSYWAVQLGPVQAVEALDEHTVRVTLSQPWEPFLAALASTSAAILPMQELRAGTFDPASDWLGTGPFVVDEHVQDEEWTLSANPSYWDAANASIQGVTIRIVPDDSARIAGLRDGSLDIGYFLGPDSSALLEGVPGVTTTVQASNDMYWLLLNAVNPSSPFTDADQRTALASSIDREGLISSVLAGNSAPTGVTPTNAPGACSPADLPTYGGGPDEGADILSAAGTQGASFSLIAPPYGPVYRDMASYLQQDFTSAGFSVSIDTPEIGAYIEEAWERTPAEFDATIDYLAGYLSPAMAAQFLVPTDPSAPGFPAFTIADPELPALLDEVNGTTDPAVRAGLVTELCQRIATAANVIPLATRSTTIGVRHDQVDADVPSFDGYDIYLRNLTTYSRQD
ncbi:MAG: ABC transporter substrate-binding protein [Cellulomonadaceae bacterium]|nr:ABC transporter substrate-binding protein [Cellulomonadaceae bacterium]